MIGSLEGIIEYLESPFVIVKVGGVGYRVILPQNESKNQIIYIHTR